MGGRGGGGGVVHLDKPLRVGWGPRVVGVATGVARAEVGGLKLGSKVGT